MQVFILLLTAVLCFNSAWAGGVDNSVSEDDDKWYVRVAPLVWVSGINGWVGTRGQGIDLDIKPSELRDFQDDLDFIAQVQIEVKKGKWGVFFDPSYLSLTYATDDFFGGRDIVSPIRALFMDAGILYEVARFTPEDSDGYTYSYIDVLGGIRYFKLRATIHSPFADLRTRGETSWIDPTIGMRYTHRFNKRWTVWTRGDVGGFNLNNSSKLSLNAYAMASYKFNPHGAIDFGMRALYIDYYKNGGLDLDLLLWGPMLGISFTW